MFPNFLSTSQATDYVRESLLWPLRDLSSRCPSFLPENHHGLCPNFNLRGAEKYAHKSSIPEMTQAIFYAMVLNDAVELGVSSRVIVNAIKSVLRSLNWAITESWLRRNGERLRKAQIPYLIELVANPVSAGDLKEDSRLSDAPFPSSDEE